DWQSNLTAEDQRYLNGKTMS
ncbi:hypothetical protein RRG08_012744, partial [Elysia crispata]